MFDLNGKVAIVTGGGSGIGTATSQRLRNAGAQVLIGDITDCKTKAAEWDCHYHQTDVSKPAEVASLCDEAIKRFGRLDIMVNNAAISSGHPLAEADEARSLKFWRVNVMGVQMGITEAGQRHRQYFVDHRGARLCPMGRIRHHKRRDHFPEPDCGNRVRVARHPGELHLPGHF